MTDSLNLDKTTDPNQRVIVGLSWDPVDIPFYLKWFMPASRRSYDLDLTCYVYDDQGKFTDIVSGSQVVEQDQTGNIYHSGDDTTGKGGGDDERIFAVLGQLPQHIKSLVFLVTCKSAHNFGTVKNPKVRLANAATDTEIESITLNDKGSDKNSYIFLRLVRNDGVDKSEWSYEMIDEFHNNEDVQDWTQILAA